jgi:hypothetical protein
LIALVIETFYCQIALTQEVIETAAARKQAVMRKYLWIIKSQEYNQSNQ